MGRPETYGIVSRMRGLPLQPLLEPAMVVVPLLVLLAAIVRAVIRRRASRRERLPRVVHAPVREEALAVAPRLSALVSGAQDDAYDGAARPEGRVSVSSPRRVSELSPVEEEEEVAEPEPEPEPAPALEPVVAGVAAGEPTQPPSPVRRWQQKRASIAKADDCWIKPAAQAVDEAEPTTDSSSPTTSSPAAAPSDPSTADGSPRLAAHLGTPLPPLQLDAATTPATLSEAEAPPPTAAPNSPVSAWALEAALARTYGTAPSTPQPPSPAALPPSMPESPTQSLSYSKEDGERAHAAHLQAQQYDKLMREVCEGNGARKCPMAPDRP